MSRWAVVGAGTAGLCDGGPVVGGRARRDVDRGRRRRAGRARRPPSHPRCSRVPFRRGTGLGGSSAVNGMIATPGDLGQYERWGWDDAADGAGPCPCPAARSCDDDELSPLDRALLAAAPDAVKATLTRRHGRRVTAADAYLPVRTSRCWPTPRRRASSSTAGAPSVSVWPTGAPWRPTRSSCPPVPSARRCCSPPRASTSTASARACRTTPACRSPLRLRDGLGRRPSGIVAATLLRRGDLQVDAAGPRRAKRSCSSSC